MTNTPQQFRDLAASAELFDTSEAIGKKFSLHIDQIGEMDAEIRDILNGVSASSDFTEHIMERLEIDRATAEKIVQEVNVAVFDQLKKRMQEGTKTADATSDIAAIERAGNFTIEKDSEERESKQQETGNAGITRVETRDSINKLAGIDVQDQTAKEKSFTQAAETHAHHEHLPPENLPGETSEEVLGIKEETIPKLPGDSSDERVDPIADHLMSNPVASVKENITVQNTSKNQSPASNNLKNDPYHESI